MTTNAFLFYSASFNRNINLKAELGREDLQNIDPWLFATIIGYIIMIFGMFNLRAVSDSGTLPKNDYESSENILGQLSDEFAVKKVQGLTQLD